MPVDVVGVLVNVRWRCWVACFISLFSVNATPIFDLWHGAPFCSLMGLLNVQAVLGWNAAIVGYLCGARLRDTAVCVRRY